MPIGQRNRLPRQTNALTPTAFAQDDPYAGLEPWEADELRYADIEEQIRLEQSRMDISSGMGSEEDVAYEASARDRLDKLRAEQGSIYGPGVSGQDVQQMGTQRLQFAETQEMFDPFMQMGTQGIAGMDALLGGEYTPSSQMEYQQGLGEMALSNAFASGGLGRSSAAQTGFGNLYADLLGEDVQRQAGDMFSMIGVGQGAMGQIGQAGQSYQQNMANIYGAQGAQNAAAAMAQGQSSANLWNTIGSGIGGIGQYMMTSPSIPSYNQPVTMNYSPSMGQAYGSIA